MAFNFNGSTMSHGSTIAEVITASFDASAREVEVTNAGDSDAIFEAGNREWTAVIEINGDSSTALGTTDTLTMTFNDGGTETFTNTVLFGRNHSGRLDSACTTVMTFKQGQA